MSFNETGFRPFYHRVCALELNDTLKEILKDCPDADKSSHAVVYGYIDPEKGLMLEVLGGGKQATQYFYFKAPYEGSRITLSISEVADVPFLWFEKLKPDNYEKYAPRIEELKQYDVSEDLEATLNSTQTTQEQTTETTEEATKTDADGNTFSTVEQLTTEQTTEEATTEKQSLSEEMMPKTTEE